MPSVNRSPIGGDNVRSRRRRDRPDAVNLNITKIEDLMEYVGQNLITKDGQV